MGEREKDSAIHRRASLAKIYAKNRSVSVSSGTRRRPKTLNSAQLDSDGTLGSGGDSDSTEEIHYGPGFVSKLKNRYMSVALRSSSATNRGTLRRTASLEDFLDEKRTEPQEEVQERFGRKRPPAALTSHLKRKESIKRCQSVEVLSVKEQKKSFEEGPPPPLPPKGERPLTVDEVLDGPRTCKAVSVRIHTKHGERLDHLDIGKPLCRRRSAGFLFGIVERELPAPDTVRETRKIFESGAAREMNQLRSPSSLLRHKSRSPPGERSRRSHGSPTFRSSPVRRVAPCQSRLPRNAAGTKPALPSKPAHLSFVKNSLEVPSLRPLKSCTASRPDEEAEVKVVSSENSIPDVRHGESSFKFDDRHGCKASLPLPNVPESTYLFGQPKQVGVIKPITREDINRSSKSENAKSDCSFPSKCLIDEEADSDLKLKLNRSNVSSSLAATSITGLNGPDENDEEKSVLPVGRLKLSSNQCHSSSSSSSEDAGSEKEAEAFVMDETVAFSEFQVDDRSEIVVTSKNGDKPPSHHRDGWKHRNSTRHPQQNTMVFNFVDSQRDVTHIENDGLDLSKRSSTKRLHVGRFAEAASGVVLLDGNVVGESTDGNSDQDDFVVDGSESLRCDFTFVGANVIKGKSSLRSQSKDKKLTVSFSTSLVNVFEYPSCSNVVGDDENDRPTAAKSLPPSSLAAGNSILDAKNNAVGGAFGGLGSYTPSKIQMSREPFQLGVSRSVPNSDGKPGRRREPKAEPPTPPIEEEAEQAVLLRPTEDATSWSGSSSSSDILF